MSQTFNVPIGVLEVGRWFHELPLKKRVGFVGKVSHRLRGSSSIIVAIAPDGRERCFSSGDEVTSLTPRHPIVVKARDNAKHAATYGHDAAFPWPR